MLNIVVSCTYRKRRSGAGGRATPEESVLLRDCDGSLEQRAEEWWNALAATDTPAVPARDLYAGEHWTTSLGLEEQARTRGIKSQLWVCSAGYGLIPVAADLKPYSATFSPGPDCVYRSEDTSLSPREATESWWELLSARSFGDSPRSLVELHSAKRASRMIVVASARYLQALRREFRSDSLCDPDQVLLVSAGFASKEDPISDLLLPADARLQKKAGGVMQSLNARLASWAMRDLGSVSSFGDVRRRFQRRLREAPDVIKFDRKPMSDERVRAFITREAARMKKRGEKPTHTRLLRMLRDSGNACEQKRFRSLFKEMESQHA